MNPSTSQMICCVNAGSSSIKFAVYECSPGRIKQLCRGICENLLHDPHVKVWQDVSVPMIDESLPETGYKPALLRIATLLHEQGYGYQLTFGHRVVHGGTGFTQPVLLTAAAIAQCEALIPLAPLHQPYNVQAIRLLQELFPLSRHVACFDTAFHRTQPREATHYAIPLSYAEEGIIRYGFHGLSYEYITAILPQYTQGQLPNRLIIAHLGNGASLCAVAQGKSVATTMGFTPLDGLMMGSRCGQIDPGVILYWLQQHKAVDEIANILQYQSGLRGVSGLSHDMKELLQSSQERAHFAISMFCYRVSREIGSLVAALGGLDALVFTAGIGEYAHEVRKEICGLSQWLGIEINPEANCHHQHRISTATSNIDVLVLHTNEEQVIAEHTYNIISSI